MADLYGVGIIELEPGYFQQGRVMRLYCWPCRTAHSFPLEDVEKIVYALGADAMMPEPISVNEPSCLKEVLRWDNPEVFAEHVEQGIECRKAAS